MNPISIIKYFLFTVCFVFIVYYSCQWFPYDDPPSVTKSMQAPKNANDTVTQFQIDLQKPLATLLIKESIAFSLILSENDLLSFYIQSSNVDISDASKQLLNTCLNQVKRCYQLLSGNQSLEDEIRNHLFETKDIPVNDSSVSVVDPGKISLQIFNEKKHVTEHVPFHSYVFSTGKPADWHNFLIFYTKVRQMSLAPVSIPVEPPVISAHQTAQKLVSIFQQTNYFHELDKFLQQYGFRNSPDLRGWIFTAIYFDYLRRSYENGYINMVLRDFLFDIEDEKEMILDFPEITPLKNYLILLQRYKLIK